MKNRLITLLALLTLAIFTNCNNDDDTSQMEFESTATISGLDLTLCGCCGGWVIDIEGQEETKRFDELPENSIIDLPNTTFPISVQLNWSESESYCGRGITIESIELAD